MVKTEIFLAKLENKYAEPNEMLVFSQVLFSSSIELNVSITST